MYFCIGNWEAQVGIILIYLNGDFIFLFNNQMIGTTPLYSFRHTHSTSLYILKGALGIENFLYIFQNWHFFVDNSTK